MMLEEISDGYVMKFILILLNIFPRQLMFKNIQNSSESY